MSWPSPRRHPRTLQEAFGPYTSQDLVPMRESRRRAWQDWALWLVAVLALAAIRLWT